MSDKVSQFVVDCDFIFQSLENDSSDYIYIWDYNSGYYRVSQNFADEFSIDEEGNDFESLWNSFVNPGDLARVKNTTDDYIKQKKSKITMEYQVINAQGDSVWLSDKSTIRYSAENQIPGIIVGVMHNLAYDGEVDSITGLLMHSKFREIYDFWQSSRVEVNGALMLLGIDEFTSINTLNSHAFGDSVLRATAQDLLNLLPDNALIYRYDGDQLLIVIDKGTKADLIELYKEIKSYTSTSHKIQDKSYRFTVSAGMATYPEDGNMWVDLEKAVSIALKEAKQTGKNHFVEFTNEMLKEKIYEQSLGRCLAESIDHDFNGFKVVFQPVCHVQNLRVKGAEILLRFVTLDGKLINPDQFIPLLEHSQLIIPVGLWVMEKAIQACKKWTAYIDDFVMNVNVSYVQLRDISFCEKVDALLDKYKLDVKHITIELTESYFITDATNINYSLKRLRDMHLQVAMDDFGTGYSSLASLSQFNVDVVKIDRSFVKSLNKSKYNYDFVESVVRLCHSVGMRVCMEGVETREEQESICVLNADFIQGFYVSRPIEEDRFFASFISRFDTNDGLVVIPNVQLRHEQLVSDKEVLSAMMDATPLALNFWNRNIEIIACNTEVLNLFEANDFKDFRENFVHFSPERQSDGKNSLDKASELIRRAFSGHKVRTYWDHIKRNGEKIPSEVTLVRIPYMEDYIVASYTRDMRKQRRLEEKIKKFNTRLAAILDANPLCINLWNRKYENIMCNKAAVDLFDLKNQEEYLERFFELSPEYQTDGKLSSEASKYYISKAFASDKAIKFDWMHHKLTGEEIPAEITLVKIEGLDEDGGDLVAGYTRDLRSQMEEEKLQQIVTARIRAVLDSSPLACILWSEEFTIIDCNEVAVAMFGAKDKIEVMSNFDFYMPKNQPDGADSIIKKAKIFQQIVDTNSIIFEWVYLDKNREEVPCEVTVVRIPLEKENIIVAYSRDLRELHHTLELNDRLSKMAYFDWLTGVFSRARFVEKLESDFQIAESGNFALILFDIDYFKSVNDTYGHEAGDIVLKRIAKSIEKMIPIDAVVGRFGGDEFIIQIKNINKVELVKLMQQIVKYIKGIEFNYEGNDFTTSISMGGSFKTTEDEDYHQLINRADKALYKAKAQGRNCSAIL